MKAKPRHDYTDRYHGVGNSSTRVAFFFGLSFFIHLVFIGALIYLPDYNPQPRFSSGVINVSLVSLPAAGPAPGPAVPAKVEKKPVKKAPLKAPPPKAPPPKTVPAPPKTAKAISLAAPKKVKKSLKKRTIKRSKIIEHAVSQIQKKVATQPPAAVAAAIERLKKKVAQSQRRLRTESQTRASGSGATAGTGPGRSGPAGAQELEVIKVYQVEIAYHIQKHWAFSEQLAGNSTDLETVLGIKILRDGKIADIWFDKKSGNDYLDDSAYKAVVLSNPLPPLPKAYPRPYYKVGLIFGPRGLK